MVSGMRPSSRSKARRCWGGGLGEFVDLDGGVVVADPVAGEGGQVFEQAAEAAHRVALGVVFGGGLGVGLGGAAGGRDGVVPGGWVLVGESHWRPGLAQVPGEIAGEHANEHVRADAVLEAVVDRAQVQVVGLDDAEVTFEALST